MNTHSPLIFKKTAAFSWSFLILLVVSIGLMVLDRQHPSVLPIRWVISTLATPFQWAVDYPQRLGRWASVLASSQTNLVKENIQLKYQQSVLEAKLQHVLILQSENAQLRALLKHIHDDKTQALAAQILEVHANSWRQLMVIDKGSQDHLRVGQAVLDAKGVMGQIIDVGLHHSVVMLISDTQSSIPVRVHRTGEWGMVGGLNRPDELVLMNLPQTSLVQPGDVVVTSGLGGHYPQGYPVGMVKKIDRLPGEAFIQVVIRPLARLNQNDLVLVVLDDGVRHRVLDIIHARLQAMGVWLS
jgi:rod shape-determining protein MreC